MYMLVTCIKLIQTLLLYVVVCVYSAHVEYVLIITFVAYI